MLIDRDLTNNSGDIIGISLGYNWDIRDLTINKIWSSWDLKNSPGFAASVICYFPMAPPNSPVTYQALGPPRLTQCLTLKMKLTHYSPTINPLYYCL